MSSLYITLLYAGTLGLFLVILSYNMMKHWVRVLGEGDRSDIDLRRAEALVSSFTDYVPLALVLMAAIEAGGAPVWILHLLGSFLVIARFMHAFGSNHTRSADAFRFLGAQMTYLIIAIASLSCLALYALPGIASIG